MLDFFIVGFALAYASALVWFASGLRHNTRRSAGKCSVSIVIAARDEATGIGACLQDLSAQAYPSDLLEVIVVDDDSTDETAEIVHRFALANLPPIRLMSAGASLAGGSKKRALTKGIAAAEGEIIVTTDAHCRVPPAWISELVACFAPEVGMVAGFSHLVPTGESPGFRERWETLDFLCLMGCAAGASGRGHSMGASSQNLAYRKSVFEEVGGFERVLDRVSGDDVLLLQLIRNQSSRKIAFATAAGSSVRHPVSASWRELWRQRMRWASNAPCQLRLDPLFFGYLAATFSVSLLFVSAPLLIWSNLMTPGALLVAGVLKVVADYLLLNRTASLFGKKEPLSLFWLWTLTQPFYVLLIGAAGMLGRTTWKGSRHRRGGSAVVDLPGSTEQTVANPSR